MANYYDEKLNGKGLKGVYDTEIDRIKIYLSEEIRFVKDSLEKNDRVLELGAGYGRIIKELAPSCKYIMGIDISKDNVKMGKEYLIGIDNAELIESDIHEVDFKQEYDIVLCLQNGLSAMKIMDIDNIKKIMRCLKPGGRGYFSTYSSKFWEHRLQWFQEQSEKGLLGEIDFDKTGNGVIVCKDGFRAVTHSKEELISIGEQLGWDYDIVEVDESSLFLIIRS